MGGLTVWRIIEIVSVLFAVLWIGMPLMATIILAFTDEQVDLDGTLDQDRHIHWTQKP